MFNPSRAKYICLATIVCSMLTVSMASAAVINPFSNDLNDYTNTVILDANGDGSNTFAWELSGLQLSLNTTVFDGIEQNAFIQNDLSLSVGDEIKVPFTDPSVGNGYFGLYVGGTTPVTGVRQNYVTIYLTGPGQPGAGRINARGFNGTSEFGILFSSTDVVYDSLFIARTASNTYEMGWYDGETRTILATRTPSNQVNDGSVVGFYGDSRAADVVGFATVAVPEPATTALATLGALGLVLATRVRPRRRTA